MAVLLTFQAGGLNTNGELVVTVNGQTVFINVGNPADTNASIYTSYGPFDITAFVVQGNNSIGFHNPGRPIGQSGAYNQVKNIQVVADNIALPLTNCTGTSCAAGPAPSTISPGFIVPEVTGGCCDYVFVIGTATQLTLGLDKTTYVQGAIAVASGKLTDTANNPVPNATINLFIDGVQPSGASTITAADGTYAFQISTTTLSVGVHSIQAQFPGIAL